MIVSPAANPLPYSPQPLAIIDVSIAHSHRPTAPRRPASRRVPTSIASVGANIVSLIPGVTRLPLGHRPA